jgi:hypothetical protein
VRACVGISDAGPFLSRATPLAMEPQVRRLYAGHAKSRRRKPTGDGTDDQPNDE